MTRLTHVALIQTDRLITSSPSANMVAKHNKKKQPRSSCVTCKHSPVILISVPVSSEYKRSTRSDIDIFACYAGISWEYLKILHIPEICPTSAERSRKSISNN